MASPVFTRCVRRELWHNFEHSNDDRTRFNRPLPVLHVPHLFGFCQSRAWMPQSDGRWCTVPPGSVCIGESFIFAGMLGERWRYSPQLRPTHRPCHRKFSDKLVEVNDGKPISFVQKALSGMASGSIAVCIGTPFDIALVRLQSDGMAKPEDRRNYKNVFDVRRNRFGPIRNVRFPSAEDGSHECCILIPGAYPDDERRRCRSIVQGSCAQYSQGYGHERWDDGLLRPSKGDCCGLQRHGDRIERRVPARKTAHGVCASVEDILHDPSEG